MEENKKLTDKTKEKKKFSAKKVFENLKEKNKKNKEEFINNLKQIKEDFETAKAERKVKSEENKKIREEKQTLNKQLKEEKLKLKQQQKEEKAKAKEEERIRESQALVQRVEQTLNPHCEHEPTEEEPFYDVFNLAQSWLKDIEAQKEKAGYKTKKELEEERGKKLKDENTITLT